MSRRSRKRFREEDQEKFSVLRFSPSDFDPYPEVVAVNVGPPSLGEVVEEAEEQKVEDSASSEEKSAVKKPEVSSLPLSRTSSADNASQDLFPDYGSKESEQPVTQQFTARAASPASQESVGSSSSDELQAWQDPVPPPAAPQPAINPQPQSAEPARVTSKYFPLKK